MSSRCLLVVFLSIACSGKSADSGGTADCVPTMLVATDIDETLTTSDGEWLSQLGDPTHDPAMRPEADLLMQGYAELGYRVVYITARGEDMSLTDGRTSREATWDWLQAHGFPGEESDLFLAEGIGAAGDPAVEYKSGVLAELAAEGQTAEWAYGNADTDILAFQAAGIADDRIFLVGELAGTMGVNPLTDEQAYGDHRSAQLDAVSPTDCLP
jgi:phosphatidate phosphatase PAH1